MDWPGIEWLCPAVWQVVTLLPPQSPARTALSSAGANGGLSATAEPALLGKADRCASAPTLPVCEGETRARLLHKTQGEDVSPQPDTTGPVRRCVPTCSGPDSVPLSWTECVPSSSARPRWVLLSLRPTVLRLAVPKPSEHFHNFSKSICQRLKAGPSALPG